MSASDWAAQCIRFVESNIPFGYCHCGCGQRTNIATTTKPKYGTTKGQPRRFVQGHGSHRRISKEEHFWQNVEKGPLDECWPWKGKTNSNGYGHFNFRSTHILSHRLSYELHIGPI